MKDRIVYVLNTADTARPVYEVNYTQKTWRVVAFERRQYGDDFIQGKMRKETDFMGGNYVEVKKPVPERGKRVRA